MHHFDSCANVVQTFWPVTFQPPSALTAFVFSEARSDPDSGSEKPWHQISSALRIGSSQRSFCSSLPWAMITGPPITRPSTFAGEGASARAISLEKIACSIRVAPRPPNSFGHEIPAQPPSCICRCQSRRNANAASSPCGSGPGWFASSQARTSSRNAVSDSFRVRSTCSLLLLARSPGRKPVLKVRKTYREASGSNRSGSIRTPGLRIASGSTARFAATRASAKRSGRCRSYQGR